MKTYNPILKSEGFKSGFFAKVPVAQEGRAIVLTVGGITGKAAVITSQEGPSAKVIRNEKFDCQTLIDTSDHMVEVDMQPNSLDYIHSFQVRMTFRTRVLNPVLVCQANITDVAGYIKRSIDGRILEEAAKYKIEEVQNFRKYLQQEFGKVFQMNDEGIQIELEGVHVDIDEASRAYLKKLNALKEKENYMKEKAAAAKSMGESLDPDTGILMSILDEKKSPEDLAEYLQKQQARKMDSSMDMVRKMWELVEDGIKKGVYSESEGRDKMKQILGNSDMQKLCEPAKQTERIEENQEEEYASFDD